MRGRALSEIRAGKILQSKGVVAALSVSVVEWQARFYNQTSRRGLND